jgi:hypothetical protein
VQRSGLTLARLMRESTDCVTDALRSDNALEQLVAMRIVDTPDAFDRWEGEHVTLMRGVAEYSALRTQLTALKQSTLSLIHGKALFEHLKKKEIRGEQRTNLIRHFHPNRDFSFAMVAVHGNYLRKTCSYLCTNYVGGGVIQDDTFIDPIQHYEELYAEYFDLYCRTYISSAVESASEMALLPLLKHQLGEWRWAILNPRTAAPRIRRESLIREATGDTQRLRALTWATRRH